MGRDRITSVILREDGIEWATLSGGRGRGNVIASGGMSLPVPAALEPGAAGAEEPSAPADTLAARLAKQEVSLGGPVTMGVDSSHLLLRVARLPSTDPDELAGMVELQADKMSPFPVDALTVSYEVLLSGADESTVLIAAARQDVLDRVRARLQDAGMEPDRVDAVVLGWWHLLKEAGKIADSGRQILVLLGATETNLLVVDDGVPVLFRSLPDHAGTPQADLVQGIASEIEYTLMSLELDVAVRHGHTIALWYTGDQPHGLVHGLAAACGCEVEAACLDGLGRSADGLARRTAERARRLDLTPAAWKAVASSKEFRRRMWLTAGGVLGAWAVLAGGFAGGFTLETHQVNLLRQQKEAVGLQAAEVRQMRQRVQLIQRYTNDTHSALECLRELCVQWAPGVEMSSFSYRKGESVKMSGSAASVDQVYAFKRKLDGSGLFQQADLQGPRQDRDRRQVFDLTLLLPADTP